MSRILAIDPGPVVSGWVLFDSDTEKVLANGNETPTSQVLGMCEMGLVAGDIPFDTVACEMIASYGMAVGKSVFDTCVQIGRISHSREMQGGRVRLVTRSQAKNHTCHSPKAKDANVRQALIDRFGDVGTKGHPGPLYGVAKHAWAALAVAVYAAEVHDPAGDYDLATEGEADGSAD